MNSTKAVDETTEAEAMIKRLAEKLPGTTFSCWGIGERNNRPHGRLYYGTVAEVDPKNACHLRLKDGNISGVILHFRPDDHVVTLHEKSADGKGHKADFVTDPVCGYDFEKGRPIYLLDYMSDLMKS